MNERRSEKQRMGLDCDLTGGEVERNQSTRLGRAVVAGGRCSSRLPAVASSETGLTSACLTFPLPPPSQLLSLLPLGPPPLLPIYLSSQ